MENNTNMNPEGKKKKHTLRNIIIAMVALFAVIGMWPSSDKEESASATSDTKEEVQVEETKTEEKTTEEPAPVENTEEKVETASGKYAQIGSACKFVPADGSAGELLITIIDINIQYAEERDNGFYVLYADTEIQNNSGDDVSIGVSSDVTLYLDDYQYADSSGSKYVAEGLAGFEGPRYSINAGRKAKVTFYDAIPIADADNAGTIEFEIIDSNATILFKDNGQWLYGDQASTTSIVATTGESTSIYGTYSLSPNEVGGHSEASVAFYTDGSGDYVAITSYDSEGGVSYDYSGSLQKDGDSYIATDKYDVSYRITFTDGGMNIEKAAGNPDDYDKEFIGSYQLIEKLNLNEVG